MSQSRTTPEEYSVHISIRITQSQKNELDAIKRMTGKTPNELVREALNEYFESHREEIKNEWELKKPEIIAQLKAELAELEEQA